MMNLLHQPLLWTTAVTGIPIPYTPGRDDLVVLLLLGCFFVSGYVLSRSRKFLLQLLKDFLLHRERTSIFSTTTAADMRCLLLLILQTCVLCAILLFCCSCELHPVLVQHYPSWMLLGIYLSLPLTFLFLKWLSYSFIGWIFFDRTVVEHWLESYSTLLYYLGFALFPFILLILYSQLSFLSVAVIGVLITLFIKILMFYKWIKLFCSDLCGILLLILYFCALEIMPCFVAYQGLIQLNDYLIIKL